MDMLQDDDGSNKPGLTRSLLIPVYEINYGLTKVDPGLSQTLPESVFDPCFISLLQFEITF